MCIRDSLSGGQRQALTLLMATMVPPKLLLLDEHTAALDPATAEKVLRLTREIVEGERITCLMITHNMKNALELGSRTFMMDAGRVVLDISGEERDVYKRQLQECEKAGDYRLVKIAKVYAEYERRLREANALDFDDIILDTCLLYTSVHF